MDERLDPNLLYKRVQILFGVEPPRAGLAPQDAASPYSSADHIETFVVRVPRANADPRDMTTIWLSTPNATFGGRCPQELLDGDQDQRAFLESILSSLEDGAFS